MGSWWSKTVSDPAQYATPVASGKDGNLHPPIDEVRKYDYVIVGGGVSSAEDFRVEAHADGRYRYGRMCPRVAAV